jgi:TonB family protein
VSGRPSLVSLGASVAAHGGLLALLFFVFVSDESFSNPLIIDLSSLETATESVSKPGPPAERPAAGPRGGPKRAGAENPVERIAAAPAPPVPASPAPVVAPEPAPAPEPVRTPEREVSKPEPAPVVAATPEPVAPREPAQSVAPSVTTSPVAGTNPAATGGFSPDGAAGRTTTQSSATSGGGSGSRVALAPGGGGGPGSEYGGYLAGVRRRVQESLQYPTSARRRGIKGTVNLEILIRADGAISSVSVAASSSHSELDEAAVEAVRSLAPQPFPAGLKPRPLRVKLPIVFDLQ